MNGTRRYDEVNWIKRYARAVWPRCVFFSGVEGCWRSHDFRAGLIVGAAVVGPISATMAMGATAGSFVREHAW
jgi:hypothetical protein